MSKGRKTLVSPGHTFGTDSMVVKESLHGISLQTLGAARMLCLSLTENSVLLQRWWHQTSTAMRSWILKGPRRATVGKTKTHGYSATNGEVHKAAPVSPSANDRRYFLSQQTFLFSASAKQGAASHLFPLFQHHLCRRLPHLNMDAHLSPKASVMLIAASGLSHLEDICQHLKRKKKIKATRIHTHLTGSDFPKVLISHCPSD